MAFEYSFEMTPEFARAAAPRLEHAVWIVNERTFAERMASRLRYREKIRVAGVVLCAGGVGLALYGFNATRAWRFITYASVFIAFMIVFGLLPRIAGSLRRFTRWLIGVRARKSMEQIARAAPYTAQYRLDETLLSATVPKLDRSLQIDLRTVRLAVVMDRIVCMFAGRREVRAVYVPGPAERAALVGALGAAGAEVVESAE